MRIAIICLLVGLSLSCTQKGAEHSHSTKAEPSNELSVQNSAAFDTAMKNVLAPYLVAQQALAGDTTDGVAKAANDIVAAVAKLDPNNITGSGAGAYNNLPGTATSAAKAMASANDITAAREHFKTLSKALTQWASIAKPQGVDLVYCSMAPGGWVQNKGPIRNPYYGSEMLTCGEVVN